VAAWNKLKGHPHLAQQARHQLGVEHLAAVAAVRCALQQRQHQQLELLHRQPLRRRAGWKVGVGAAAVGQG
jgi:hypothetical protein